MKKLITIILTMLILNGCGSIYYTIMDGEFPKDTVEMQNKELTSKNVNWLVILSDITFGMCITGFAPEGIIVSTAYITIDYLTNSIFKYGEKK